MFLKQFLNLYQKEHSSQNYIINSKEQDGQTKMPSCPYRKIAKFIQLS